MKIPSEVKIGVITYRVIITDHVDDEHNLGETDHDALTIKIKKSSPVVMENVFLHELLHTFNTEYKDELMIQNFADCLQSLIKNNPGIFHEN